MRVPRHYTAACDVLTTAEHDTVRAFIAAAPTSPSPLLLLAWLEALSHVSPPLLTVVSYQWLNSSTSLQHFRAALQLTSPPHPTPALPPLPAPLTPHLVLTVLLHFIHHLLTLYPTSSPPHLAPLDLHPLLTSTSTSGSSPHLRHLALCCSHRLSHPKPPTLPHTDEAPSPCSIPHDELSSEVDQPPPQSTTSELEEGEVAAVEEVGVEEPQPRRQRLVTFSSPPPPPAMASSPLPPLPSSSPPLPHLLPPPPPSVCWDGLAYPGSCARLHPHPSYSALIDLHLTSTLPLSPWQPPSTLCPTFPTPILCHVPSPFLPPFLLLLPFPDTPTHLRLLREARLREVVEARWPLHLREWTVVGEGRGADGWATLLARSTSVEQLQWVRWVVGWLMERHRGDEDHTDTLILSLPSPPPFLDGGQAEDRCPPLPLTAHVSAAREAVKSVCWYAWTLAEGERCPAGCQVHAGYLEALEMYRVVPSSPAFRVSELNKANLYNPSHRERAFTPVVLRPLKHAQGRGEFAASLPFPTHPQLLSYMQDPDVCRALAAAAKLGNGELVVLGTWPGNTGFHRWSRLLVRNVTLPAIERLQRAFSWMIEHRLCWAPDESRAAWLQTMGVAISSAQLGVEGDQVDEDDDLLP